MPNKERILFIDDSPDIRAMYDLLFTGMGFEVFTSSDGSEGLRHYKDLLCPIVILDAMLPSAVTDGLNGFILSAKIKTINPAAITIIVTGLPDDAETRMRILDSRADAILIKPVSAEGLLIEIRTVQAKRETLKPKALRAPEQDHSQWGIFSFTGRELVFIAAFLIAVGVNIWFMARVELAITELQNKTEKVDAFRIADDGKIMRIQGTLDAITKGVK